MSSSTLTSVRAFRDEARRVLPPQGFETLFFETEGHGTCTNNLAAIDQVRLRPRVLSGNRQIRTTTTVLGREISRPIIVAPAGGQQRLHPRGELASAEGAASAGTVMALSSLSSFGLGEVADVSNAGLWFQLYLTRDRAVGEALVRIAEQRGYEAIVLTVDNVGGFRSTGAAQTVATTAAREAAFWSAGHADPARALRIFADLPVSMRPRATLAELVDPAPTWKDVAWLASITRLPIVVKGVQTWEDALCCLDAGASALVVSNHGGASHGLDGLVGSISVLPEVVEAVDGRLEVYVDGGFRHGRDVLKALALGARAVLVGRPALWGVAVDGAQGVLNVLNLITAQLEAAMGLCGFEDARHIPRRAVSIPAEWRMELDHCRQDRAAGA